MKPFPFSNKMITSSLRSIYTKRRLSQDSNNRFNTNEENNSSIKENSSSSRKHQEFSDENEKVNSLMLGRKDRKRFFTEVKTFQRNNSFKMENSQKMKENLSFKSKEYKNLNDSSNTSNDNVQFSSYSEQIDSVDSEIIMNEIKKQSHNDLNKLCKNSWSFSFD